VRRGGEDGDDDADRSSAGRSIAAAADAHLLRILTDAPRNVPPAFLSIQ
jgi:hypothetical protein